MGYGWLRAAVVGVGMMAIASPARADAPGIYYAWRSLNLGVISCINRANSAFTTEGLSNIQSEGNSVSGQTETVAAVAVCLAGDAPNTSTVMLIVSSDDDVASFNLREALKAVF